MGPKGACGISVDTLAGLFDIWPVSDNGYRSHQVPTYQVKNDIVHFGTDSQIVGVNDDFYGLRQDIPPALEKVPAPQGQAMYGT